MKTVTIFDINVNILLGISFILKIKSMEHIKILPDPKMNLNDLINGSEIFLNEVKIKKIYTIIHIIIIII